MPRALVTGITGQDGSYLVELLLANGYEVAGMVRSVEHALVPARVTLVEGELLAPESLWAAVEATAPDELYHLAAPTFVPDSWDDPTATVQAIAGGAAALIAAVIEHAPKARVVVAASSEVFGDAGESPQHEETPMRPRTPYGVAKLAAHGLVRSMRARHGLHLSSAITFNHESPRRPERFLPRKVTRAAAAIALGLEEEVVLGDLDAVRDWSDARDVVRGLHLMARSEEPGDYVLASGVGRPVRELVDVAFAHAGVDPEEHVRIDPALVRAPEPWPLVGDPTRAGERLGWRPEHSFAETIGAMVDADLAALRG